MFRLLILSIVCITFFGCNKSITSKNTSSATGWAINAKGERGFQYNTDFKGQEAGPGLVFIEGGTYTKGKVQDDVMYDYNNSPNQQHVQSFYMDENEVTNMMYLEYLDWIKRNFPPSDPNFKDIYNGALPDTLVWRNRLGYSENMVENYLRHPAYGNYPVVGVSWVQASEFAKWRSDRYNEFILEQEGYLTRDAKLDSVSAGANFSIDTYVMVPNQTYGGNQNVLRGKRSSRRADSLTPVSASRETGFITPKYRLPLESEWEYAALGLTELREFNIYRGRKKYPWDGQYTRSGKRKILGDQLANFKNSDGDYGGIAGWSDDGADITNQVKSYSPNDFGLYDMAGNVAEWVADVYRPIVDDEFNDFNYYRGNVYKKNEIKKDGSTIPNVNVISVDSVVYRTLSNGKRVAVTLPGEISKIPVDENETKRRTNFDESYNVNFRDGDLRSSRSFLDLEGENSLESNSDQTRIMYNSPDINETNDGSKRTSLINDQVRVYKGGSWKDRAYWLDPAQRRFYPEDMATDFIGFRCAMSRVGSKNSYGNKKRN